MKNTSKAMPTIRHIPFPAFMDRCNLLDEFLMFKNNWLKEFCMSSIRELSANAWLPISWLTFLNVDNLLASSSSLLLF